MTESEARRLVLQSARNARKAYRRADSAGEVLERWLDRMIDRKTRIRFSQAEAVIVKWEAYRDNVGSLEKALGDFLQATMI